MAYNAAPANVNQQLGPVQQVARQAEVIDLTGDDEPVPAGPAATPAPQCAGTKRASPDSTTGRSAPKAKKPRYGWMAPTNLPSSAAQEMPAALPTPPVRKSPRGKRADPHNLLGNFHKTFVAKPVNPQLAKGAKSPAADGGKKLKGQPKASSDKKIDQRAEIPAADGSDDLKTQIQASFDNNNIDQSVEHFAADGSDDLAAEIQAAFDCDNEQDAEGSTEDESVAPDAISPADSAVAGIDGGSGHAPAADKDLTPQASAPADEVIEDVELAVDENDNIICDSNGGPMLLSRYLAGQAAAAMLEFAFDKNGNHICDGLGMPLTVREMRASQQMNTEKDAAEAAKKPWVAKISPFTSKFSARW